jgi:hypothetical protein
MDRTYRRHEIFEALRGDEREVHQAEIPSEGILDRVPQAVPGTTHLLIATAVGHKHTILCHLPLLFVKEARVIRPVRQREESTGGDQERDNSFNQEEPLPSVQTCDVVHVFEDSCCQETGDNVADSISSVPDGHTHGTLFFGIPCRSH